jgi:asparagine synthase (glutamine-hydrolysing)
MCGICGEVRWDEQAADVGAITRMTAAMKSRGPDSDGVVAHGPVALGHRRLSIIDLSARGAQPMVDSDLGLTLVFNGCIYNYKDSASSRRSPHTPSRREPPRHLPATRTAATSRNR